MAYKSPIEQIEGDLQEWKPSEFKDVSLAYNKIPGSKKYRFKDGDYSGVARLYDLPNENNINEGRVGKDLELYYKDSSVPYTREEHKEFMDKLLTYLDAYGFDLK